jgi:hypothetical protein
MTLQNKTIQVVNWSYFGSDIGALIPAYGRVYKDLDAALQSWQSGKDFRICYGGGKMGPYCSVRDLQFLQTRFDKLYLILSSTSECRQIF